LSFQVDGVASAKGPLSDKIGSVIFRKPRGRGMDSVGRRGRPWKAVEDISVHGRPGGNKITDMFDHGLL
jgi:hypothetical protein